MRIALNSKKNSDEAVFVLVLWHIIWPDHCSLLCYLLLLYIKYLNLGGYLVESTIVDSHEIRPLAGICMSGTTWLFKYVVWMEWPTSISGPDSIYTLVKFGLKFCTVNVPKWAESCSTLVQDTCESKLLTERGVSGRRPNRIPNLLGNILYSVRYFQEKPNQICKGLEIFLQMSKTIFYQKILKKKTIFVGKFFLIEITVYLE